MANQKIRIGMLCGVSVVAACGGSMDLGGRNSASAGTAGAALGAAAGAGGDQVNEAGRRSGGEAGTGGKAGSGGSAGSAGRNAGAGGEAVAGGGSGAVAGTLATAGVNGEGGDDSVAGSGGTGGVVGEPTCDCATSEALTLLDCGTNRSYALYPGTYLAADGSTVLFAPGENSQVGLLLGHWSASTGTSITDGYPLGLSADGSTALVSHGEAFYLWKIDSNEVPIPADVRLLSEDGNVAVGHAETSPGIFEIIRWTEAGGVVGTGVTGNVAADAVGAIATAVSSDASVIGGAYFDSSVGSPYATSPFLSSSEGQVLIGEAPSDGSTPTGWLNALSADGTVAAGVILVAENDSAYFLYSEAGMTVIDHCEGDPLTCVASAGLVLSADGRVLAGNTGLSPTNAFRYTEEDGMVAVAPGEFTVVRGMSADGSVILGTVMADTDLPGAAFVWDATQGMRLLRDVLADSGADLEGWALLDGYVLSKTGNVAVGVGTCGGHPALYRAVIPD